MDLGVYTTCSFNPHLFSEALRAGAGCGPSALALLTGELPRVIAAENRSQPHTSARFVANFLRARGYGVLELTRANLVMSPIKIRPSHVLLLAQLFRFQHIEGEYEGTWSVLHQNVCYHNGDHYTIDSLSLVNKPIVSALLVVHPRWRRFSPEQSPKPERNTEHEKHP